MIWGSSNPKTHGHIHNINLEDAIQLINQRKIKIGQKTKKKT